MRLVDLHCLSCLEEFEDVWKDEVFTECPLCHNGTVEQFWKHAPIVDAKMPFYVESLGRKFTSTMQMERYAKSQGKVIDQVDGRHPKARPARKTVEERLLDGQKKANLRETIKKSAYRLRHGYVDTPKLTTEAQLAKET